MQGGSHELGASFPCQKQLKTQSVPAKILPANSYQVRNKCFVSWNCTQKQSCVFLYPFPSGLGGGCHPSLLSSCGMKGDVCAHLRRTETQHRVAASADGMLVWAQGVRARGSRGEHGGRSAAPSGLLVLFAETELATGGAQTTPRLSGQIRSWCRCFLLGDLHKARKRAGPLKVGLHIKV